MSIIKDVYETKQQRSRFLLRLVPVEIVTKAFMDDLRSKADAVLEKYFSQEPKTFSIVFKLVKMIFYLSNNFYFSNLSNIFILKSTQ